ncbi:MAG: DoxX family membrane protein [Candidatus Paceibacterota bacterium]
MKKLLNPSSAPYILRFGLAFVLVWFGSNQLLDPAPWTGLIPSWIISLGISATVFVYINGIVEIILALLLVLNKWTRVVSILVFLHLVSIVIDVGFNGVGIRDIGLAMMALATSALGEGKEENQSTSLVE